MDRSFDNRVYRYLKPQCLGLIICKKETVQCLVPIAQSVNITSSEPHSPFGHQLWEPVSLCFFFCKVFFAGCWQTEEVPVCMGNAVMKLKKGKERKGLIIIVISFHDALCSDLMILNALQC
ncbi:hypothetical protein L873DRAFT_276394 [Choiromyces venosus 120613-1]|uniref:Uncharacterized protein n=1 Tax=Choiromyces venosus 120613-1 TaxID=1336337 RepID=A0A3N4KAW9_9PEZI|nr:hypothetical protein L873DRAFT_276394 [Choiromyces venosus 120613-1]